MKGEGDGLAKTSHSRLEKLPFCEAASANSAVMLRHLDLKAAQVVSGRKATQNHIRGECGNWYGVVEFPECENTHEAIG